MLLKHVFAGLEFDDFELKDKISDGDFGRLVLCRRRSDGKYFSMLVTESIE